MVDGEPWFVGKDVAEILGYERPTKATKEYFAGNKIYIFPCCENLIREIKSYRWGEGDIPVKKDDHALDELRYYVMSRPHKSAPIAPLNAIQKDKERLIRRLKTKGGN